MLLFICSPLLSFKNVCHFNTSHVTVYHNQAVMNKLNGLFQYISCYCLSLRIMTVMYINTDFNTSHVTVYQHRSRRRKHNIAISIHLMLLFIVFRRLCRSCKNNFNTSHVTVYHYKEHNPNRLHGFQYISCYCLSFILFG